MRRIITVLSVSVFVLGLTGAAFCAGAEHVDPIKVAGDHYKVLLENENVRVLDFTAKAGDKIPAHWHPDHVVYVISGGKTKFNVDGKEVDVDMKNGTAMYLNSQTHSAEIVGPGDTHVVIVELKTTITPNK